METIKVNMTPCEDVQTIHASQNDSEAREWGFELHNNGDVIDSSEISDQLVFKAYKGGTEQILPENGSVPTTSPIIADIKYSQGLLTDQEFLYRESPTESDGLAKIQTIYGNTLKWNQLVQNGNFASSNVWQSSMGTMTFSNNELTYKPTSIGNVYYANQVLQQGLNVPTNHVLFLHCETYVPYNNGFYMSIRTNQVGQANVSITNVTPTPNSWSSFSKITKLTNTMTDFAFYWSMDTRYTTNDTVKLRNVNIIDLTQMFGQTKAEEILAMGQTDGIAYLRSLFPLPYYQYDSGSLLPFRGEGLKTVGKNLFDGVYNNLAFGNTVEVSNLYRGYTLNVSALKGKQITVSRADTTSNNRFRASFFSTEPHASTQYERELNNGSQYYSYDSQLSFTLTVPNGANYLLLYISNNGAEAKDLMIEIGSAVSDYEPYTSSTTSLPVSTYFPNGMNGVNNVYDEWSEVKTIKRMDGYTFTGNETWSYSLSARFWQVQLPITNYAKTVGAEKSSNGIILKFVNNYYARAYLDDNPSLSDSSAMNSIFSNGTQIVYELATPTETSFTTASLVTENAEIPLSNEEGVLIGKCTEELSAEPGFHDAKIKLADADGECYSNKIQLHVERKPS